MKSNSVFRFIVASSLIIGLAGCNNKKPSEIPAKITYDIKFVNYDESVLQELSVEEGQLPVYTGETPTKPSTDQYHYVYEGWDKEIVAAVADATYTATFKEEINTYSVIFMSNGQEYKKETVAYGEKVEKPTDPIRERTAEEIYIFDGWELNEQLFDFDNAITSDITLIAKWDVVSATEHGNRCSYIHYPAVEPTYAKPGHTEFWFCELHSSAVLEEPLTGEIKEAEEEYPYEITSDMPMYIPQIEGGNIYMSLMAGQSTDGKAIVRTEEMLDTMLTVSFRYRVKNATESKWFGVAITSNPEPSCYSTYWEGEGDAKEEKPLEDVYCWKVIEPAIDGMWHEVSFDLEEQSGYLAFVHASGDFEEDAIIEVDNVFLETGADEYIEEFTNQTMFKFLNKYGDVDGELKQNDFLRLVNMDSAPELALVISKRSYSNISNVTFKYRVSTETFKDNIQPWINVIITSNGKDPDVYGGGAVTNTFFAAPKNDGQWHRISLDISGTGYVAFGNESGHWGLNQTLDYDDIEITYSDGKKAIDSFDSVLLFKATSDATHAKKFTIASEEIIIDEGGDNYMVRLDVGTLGWKEKGLLYTTESYSDITSISFKIRITGQVKEGKESSWMSVNINDTCSNWSGLNNYNRPTDGEWHEITVNIDNQTGHIVFAYNMFDYEEGTVMDFDDIIITTSNGTIEENFNGPTSIFTLDGEYASIEINK